MIYSLLPPESEHMSAQSPMDSGLQVSIIFLYLKCMVFLVHSSVMYESLHSNVDSSKDFRLLSSDNNTNLNFFELYSKCSLHEISFIIFL